MYSLIAHDCNPFLKSPDDQIRNTVTIQTLVAAEVVQYYHTRNYNQV